MQEGRRDALSSPGEAGEGKAAGARAGGPGGAGAAGCSRPGARRRRSPLRAGRPKMSDGPRAASAHAPRTVSMCRAAAHVRWARVRRRPAGTPPPRLAPQVAGRTCPSPRSQTSRRPRGSNRRLLVRAAPHRARTSPEGEGSGGGPCAGERGERGARWPLVRCLPPKLRGGGGWGAACRHPKLRGGGGRGWGAACRHPKLRKGVVGGPPATTETEGPAERVREGNH